MLEFGENSVVLPCGELLSWDNLARGDDNLGLLEWSPRRKSGYDRGLRFD